MTKQTNKRGELLESDIWTRAIVENAVDGIITIDEKGMIEYVNPAAETIFGYSGEELAGKNVSVLMPAPHRDRHDSYIDEYKKTGVAKVIGIGRELMGLHKNGSLIPLELSVSEVWLGDRRIFTGILHDIRSRRESQEEKDRLLRDLNKRNLELTCLYRVGESIRGRELLSDVFSDVVELVPSAFLHSETTRARITFDGEIFQNHMFDSSPWSLVSPIVMAGRKRGTFEVFYLEEREVQEIGPFLQEEAEFLQTITSTLGVTLERREAEAQVIQASKLASIGELAAGVGHEINNPVNGIMNCADILIGRSEEGTKDRQFAELIRSEADRIAKIVRNLLTFSRQDREHHSPARLCDIVEVVLSLTRKKLAKSHVILLVDVPDSLPKIRCRSEQIQQVVMNLIINALHALDEQYPGMHPNKTLRLEAEPAAAKSGSFVRLTIEDHGTGIQTAHMERLFDPFFTTKGRDKGTGLGLSVSDGIIKEHEGNFSVESEYGKFTRFTVDLPLALSDEDVLNKVKEA